MIPVKATDADVRGMADNILSEYRRSTEDDRAEGFRWYRDAHKIATTLGYGDAKQGAALLAALSPQTSWELNVKLAAKAVNDGRASGHLGDACRKADRILSGWPAERVLPMDKKTGDFYRCIADPGDPDSVCVDRHAHDIAVGERYGSRNRGLDARGRYVAVQRAYRLAAKVLGILPQELQAITWVSWRRRIGE